MSNITPELLRQLAEDMEQRPDERCWEVRDNFQWHDVYPLTALVEVVDFGYTIRRKAMVGEDGDE